jgi:hypothetical protein
MPSFGVPINFFRPKLLFKNAQIRLAAPDTARLTEIPTD